MIKSNTSDFIVCAIRDKKTQILGNLFMARNKVEMERDLFHVISSPQSPYKDFEKDYEVCILGAYNLYNGLYIDIENSIEVFKNLDEIKNINLNDKEALNDKN